MRLLFMAPLWIAYKFCLLALKTFSAACLLLDALDRGAHAVRNQRKAG